MLRKETQENIKEQLVRRRNQLVRQLSNLEEEVRSLRAENSTELFEVVQRDMAEFNLSAIDASERRELENITRALAKIKAGKYGICEECEDWIDLKRLIALAEVRLCIQCQTRAEELQKIA